MSGSSNTTKKHRRPRLADGKSRNRDNSSSSDTSQMSTDSVEIVPAAEDRPPYSIRRQIKKVTKSNDKAAESVDSAEVITIDESSTTFGGIRGAADKKKYEKRWPPVAAVAFRKGPYQVKGSKRELENLVLQFLDHNHHMFEINFNKFLEKMNHLPVKDDVLLESLKVYEKFMNPLNQLQLFDVNRLSAKEVLGLSTMIYRLPEGDETMDYEWASGMMKHSKLKDTIFEFFADRCGSTLYGEYEQLCARPKEEVFFLAFFVRVLQWRTYYSGEDPLELLPLDFLCPYCNMMGVHFASECYLKYSQELKDAYLEGFCNVCTDGRNCDLGLHEPENQCHCGQLPIHDPDMCKHPNSIDDNDISVIRIKEASRCFRGWSSRKLQALFYDLVKWYRKNKDHPNALRFKPLHDYLKYQANFPPTLWKVDVLED